MVHVQPRPHGLESQHEGARGERGVPEGGFLGCPVVLAVLYTFSR